jgi:purine-nucleoside phosphorylase
MTVLDAAEMHRKIQEAIAAIRKQNQTRPRIGLILGSGLGAYADHLADAVTIPFDEIPHFPKARVAGHSGNLILGLAEGVPVAALQGRAHFYQGYTMPEVVFPARVLGCLGIRGLIVTNAAGGIKPDFRPGDLMLITDHINLMGGNPLIGENLDALGPRFPDMSEAYSRAMREAALHAAAERGLSLREGIYVGLAGPSYETPAEIRMCRTLGADAVGMSTVPEVIVASHMGIPVLGISCITNMAAGILPQKLTHKEVIDTTERVREQFISLLQGVIPLIARHSVEGAGA